ncbi:PREDICTED: uncharacterized protein LOC108760463 [Trachymyrmex cornetzi]|uniref:uncharacterized protein LOC108760463 n=1 Tax=Trachymyrmex cornetzi TaxID=471704 RepID=UPI00084EEDCE|nr:PREDICTED: uncharacterized protein LOC108760463 [Trachymyrmex cornetzi]
MLRILILVLFLRLSYATLSSEVTSYARVSRNGQPGNSFHDSLSWITRPVTRNTSVENENRSINDVVVTASPVYVAPKTSKLKKGEAMDYPVGPRYSTLDHEMIAKLDEGKKRIQQRFNPPASGFFIKDSFASSNGRPQKGASTLYTESSPSINSSAFPGPIFPGIYEYNPSPVPDDESPMSKPIISKYPPASMDDNIPDSYKPSPNKYHTSSEHEVDYSDFTITSSYENDGSGSKPMKFANHHDHSSPFIEDSYEHDHHNFHHDVIYDHVPVYHEHHPKTTTEEPEMNDQRLDKRPYSYYFIGKKLWYIPLYFSIYLIIYIAALVLKSIARHKINLPTQLEEIAHHRKRREFSEGWWYFTERILEGIERFAETSGKISEH